MSDPERLQRFPQTDPRDAGCDEAMAVLHISADLAAACTGDRCRALSHSQVLTAPHDDRRH